MTRPLLVRYPTLASRLPCTELGEFPTPIHRAARFGAAIGLDRVYVKRDDLSGPVYGGNKVRKLEFLLGKALHDGRGEVLTFGFAGSNHALATAIYAKQVGLRSISTLLPQPLSHALRRNLLMGLYSGAELHHYPSRLAATFGTLYQLARHRLTRGAWPQIIPAGGSSPLGIMGIVNAVIELDEQIRAGQMPPPDRIYTAVGSMGTAVGLLIGLALTGCESNVVCVRVIDTHMANPAALERLYTRTVAYMRQANAAIPDLSIPRDRLEWRDDYFGERYALYTPEGVKAVRTLDDTEGIRLDGTYAGKALAALIGDARRGALDGQTVLFWNTYNARRFWESMPSIDYHALPRTLHRYFEEPVQPLDT
ncbi:MAG: pyridoxal-phosphate dependent enzyme [Candidatus Hydrogenedentes bacterium]|nr:pyridoxal-phosphate dependent enzyme [Candidatus Hydrogenedentota bacterium]